MYVVVLRQKNGVLFWLSSKSKTYFNKWYNEEKKAIFEIVQQGITRKEAEKICSSLNNRRGDLIASVADLGGGMYET